MKLQFDGNQVYQLEAVQAVIDLFDGQPLQKGALDLPLMDSRENLFQNQLGVGNRLLISEETIIKNLKKVQGRNGIKGSQTFRGMNFSVEMETGTGKTYVYLRTIYELHVRYGFTKFIIVVPSVAIREGVLKNLYVTREHFQTLYGNIPVDYWVYHSKRVSKVRQFATSNQVQILIINIDAFNKKSNNIIFHEQDKLAGHKPIEFIQATNPIVIIDEPQNMESTKARRAIESLKPLCTLRYSATHRNPVNLLYRLDPVTAYDLRLVKQIEVDSVVSEDNYNQAFIRLDRIAPAKTTVSARLTIHVDGSSGPQLKTVTVKTGDDLFLKSNRRAAYGNGYIVSEINAGKGYISFANGTIVYLGQAEGGMTDEIMKAQVRETVKEHFEKELQVKGKGIKVLSLFFVDRVANYRYYENGRRKYGKIARWFMEAFQEFSQKPRYQGLIPFAAEQVHSGYFSQDHKGRDKDTSGNTRADHDTYNLIMKDKERLLSIDEPVRFIFSHSALREGWDNPNVFQICTLNETKSEIKKRQEIGRGLRLPVDQTGCRVFDEKINRLTVIANESYQEFANKLQKEITEECGVDFSGRIKNKRERKKAGFKKGVNLDESFKQLWERIKLRTRYSIEYDTEDLIKKAAEAVQNMPAVSKPRIRAEKVKVDISGTGVDTSFASVSETAGQNNAVTSIPDLLSYMMQKTNLTRSTLAQILIRSGRLNDVYVNPQQFMDMVLKAIKRELNEIMVNGIKYEKIAGEEYEMLLLEEQEIESYLNTINLFVKLPAWFKVETPIGTYNPDWAIVKQDDQKLYLIRETKSAQGLEKLHLSQLN